MPEILIYKIEYVIRTNLLLRRQQLILNYNSLILVGKRLGLFATNNNCYKIFPILACKEFINYIWHLKYINLPELFYLNRFQSYFWTKHSKLHILCIALCSFEYQNIVQFPLIERNRANRVINRNFFLFCEDVPEQSHVSGLLFWM